MADGDPIDTGLGVNVIALGQAEREAREKRKKNKINGRSVPPKVNGTHPPATNSPDWHNDPAIILDKSQHIAGNLANTITALKLAPEWRGRLGYDELAHRVTLLRPSPWAPNQSEMEWPINGVHWTDTDDLRLTEWMQRRHIAITDKTAAHAIEVVAHENSFHPVRDYLNNLIWDGRPRIDQWLTYYLGVVPTPFSAAVGRRWLIAAIARILRPGCQADHCLVLEGPQGKMKSTALRTLADPWFTDDIAALGTKDAAMQTDGVWIIEIAELDRMSSQEVATVKAFIPRRVDRFRPPYGRRIAEHPRCSVFAATVNLDAYLKDETGGRRFWPVKVVNIDLEALQADKDQIWAETLQAFNAGETWWLESEELKTAASEEQDARYETDSWEPDIYRALIGINETSLGEIYEIKSIPFRERDPRSDRRLSKVLRRIGFTKFRKRVGTELLWKYRRSDDDL